MLTSFIATDAFAKTSKKKKSSKSSEVTKTEDAKPVASSAPATASAAAPAQKPATAAPVASSAPAAAPASSSNPSVFDGAMPDNSGTGIDFIKQPGRLGVGLTFGIPGFPVTAKYFLQKNFSISAYAPFYLDYASFGLGIDFEALYEGGRIWGDSSFDLSWQVGGGAGAYWLFKTLYYVHSYGFASGSSGIDLAFHGNIGIQLILKSLPIEVAWDYRPGLEVVGYPSVSCDANNLNCHKTRGWGVEADPFGFSLSGRYYF